MNDMTSAKEQDAPVVVYHHTDLEVDQRQRDIFTAHAQQTLDHTGPALLDGQDPAKPCKRRTCGLPGSVFVVITGLLILLVAVAIGGGVGGGVMVRRCNDRLQACRDNITAEASAIPETGCPDIAGQTYTTSSRYVFRRRCSGAGIGGDLVGVVVSSWELCMEACGLRNFYAAHDSDSGDKACLGVSFSPEWIRRENSVSNFSAWGNCFLKYKLTNVAEFEGYRIPTVGAELQD